MDEKIIETVRHIFQARIDQPYNSHTWSAYRSALDIFNYAVEGNYECLKEFDYLMTNADCGLED